MKKILVNIIGWVLTFMGCVLVAELDMTVRAKFIKLLMNINNYVADNAVVWCVILATTIFVGIKVLLKLAKNARGHIA